MDDSYTTYIYNSYVLRLKVEATQKTTTYVFASVAVILVAAGVVGALSAMPASAQGSSGQFNPQTQFAVGTTLQITSIYGLESLPAPTTLAGFNYGSHTGSGYNFGNHNQTIRTGLTNQQWNLTYLRNTPTANSSITINAEVTNETQDGGILWTVQGGSIVYNGTTLTVTSGSGGIGKLDRILTVGNATDSNGNTYRWTLEGLATLYGGTVLVSLNGFVAEMNQSTASPTTARPYQAWTMFRAVSITYIATIS
jgi:hypothetical protein